MVTKQIKSRKRVTDHGEVFTSEREVNAMLDLVKQETEREDSRFLEPACGDGNFLVEILSRKLAVLKKKYKKLPLDFERFSILAVGSVYGVDILHDNVLSCQERLYNIWDEIYKAVCKKEVNEDCRKSVRFIISRNIVCGNALSLKKVDEKGNDTDEPIIFSEWAFATVFNLKRRDFTFDKLLKGNVEGRDLYGEEQNDEAEQTNLFSESVLEKEQSDDEGEFLGEYISHYRRVHEIGR